MEPLAKSLLVLMVRGLFSPFQFPYAQFACSSLTGDQLHSIFWDAVRRLERYHFIIHNTHTPVEDIIRLQDRHQSTMCNLRRLLCEPTVHEATRERQMESHTKCSILMLLSPSHAISISFLIPLISSRQCAIHGLARKGICV